METGLIVNNFIADLVKANEAVVTEVENDPELKKRYEEDSKRVFQSQQFQDLLTAILFDNAYAPSREEGSVKYIDVATSPTIPYIWLRRAGATEIPRLIKNLRRLQLTEFGEPAARKKFGKELGFSLTWKDPTYEPTREETKTLNRWESRLQEFLFFPAGETNPSLPKFLGECYENFFDFDDMTVRIMRDGVGYPIGVRMEDPSLWKPIIPKVLKYPRHDHDVLEGIEGVKGLEVEELQFDYMMIRNHQRIEAVTKDHVRKSHFFTRSDYQLWRRGYSIMEQAVNVTSIIINAFQYNASNFSTNRTPMGVLALTGGFTNQLLVERLKKVLWANMSGVTSQRRLPIVGLPENADAKWVSMHATNKEMEFYTGLTLFASIVCGLSGTNPNELGLASFQDAMKGNRLNEANNDGIWRQSQDNGLKTFVNHVENTLNVPNDKGMNIFEEITNLPVKVEFKGLASEDVKEKMDVDTKRLQATASINELRREAGLDPAEYLVGEQNIFDIVGISNPNIAAFIRQDVQQKQQAEMQQQQMEAAQNQQAAQTGAESGELTDRDQQLIDQYGAPQGQEQGQEG